MKSIIIPEKFSLKDKIEYIFDQGQINSCTTNAIAQQMRVISDNKVQISRLFQHINSRIMEDTQWIAEGANLRDCFKALGKYNYVHENEYPYDESKVCQIPPAELYIKAHQNSFVHSYKSINNHSIIH